MQLLKFYLPFIFLGQKEVMVPEELMVTCEVVKDPV